MRPPSIDAIRATREAILPWLTPTPVMRCLPLEEALGGAGAVLGKMEFLQRTGTFKARGALTVMRDLDPASRKAGVTAVSAGNHAIAVAFAAQTQGVSAKVVMLRSSNAERVGRCREFGAEVVLADDVHAAFATAQRIESDEGRYFVHPFDSEPIVRGTATLGLEFSEQAGRLDAVIVPIGGGGLCAGVASAIKQLQPDCALLGVEPTGADSMHRSFAAEAPIAIDRVRTIADSLGAPYALPYTFELCRRFVDDVVLVSDDELRNAMRRLFQDMKLAVEPACAATTAALLGPLARPLRGKRVGLVLCGSNIDWESYARDARVDA